MHYFASVIGKGGGLDHGIGAWNNTECNLFDHPIGTVIYHNRMHTDMTT